MRELRKLREGLVEGLKERPAVRQGRMPASPQTLQHWATIKRKRQINGTKTALHSLQAGKL